MVKKSQENLALLQSMKRHFWEMRTADSRTRVWLKILSDCQCKGFFLERTVHHLYKDKWPGIIRNIRKKINEKKPLTDLEDEFLKVKRIVDPLFELVDDEDRKAIAGVVNEILGQICVSEQREVSSDDGELEILEGDTIDPISESISSVLDDFHDIPLPSPQRPPPMNYFWTTQAETMQEFKKYCILQQQYIEIKMEKAKLELATLKKKLSED